MKDWYVIYGIREVGGSLFFYIGCTKYDTKTRFSLHKSSSKNGHDANKAKCKILNDNNIKTEIVELDKLYTTKLIAHKKERSYIESYRSEGHPLTNRKNKDVKYKSLKITENVHEELKVFCAKKRDNMSAIGGFAIVQYLKRCGHQFIHQTKLKKNSTNQII